MSPDDPRHGETAGYWAGCRLDCCRMAINRYAKRLRTRQYLAGGSLMVDAIGTKRRIRALMALGWPTTYLDTCMGRERTYSVAILCGSDRINAATAALIRDVYDQLSMTLPADCPDIRAQIVSRTRNQARRKGWPPPLAWDDIDDPAEQPAGWEYEPAQAADRAETLRELAARGVGVSEACRVLGMSRDSLQKWCGNNDLSPLYRRLASREDGLSTETRTGTAVA